MKILGFTLVSLLAATSFANLTSSQIDQLCLDLLVQEAGTIGVTGDVHPSEKLPTILLPVSERQKYPNTEIQHSCIKVSYDGIYECKLFIIGKVNGVPMGETYLEYAAWVGQDEKPTKILNKYVEISRGH
jgi:hypothetical protein